MSFRDAFRRAYWAAMLRFKVFGTPGGIAFIYVGALHDRPANEIACLITEAFQVLDAHAPDDAGLVRRRLRFIAAVDFPHSYTLPDVQGYLTQFDDGETAGAPLLASQFVWAGAFIDALMQQQQQAGGVNRPLATQSALQRQREFLGRLPDGERWLRHFPSSLGDSEAHGTASSV